MKIMTKNERIKLRYALAKKFENIPTSSGIYLWTRFDEKTGITGWYVGKAKNLRNRRIDYEMIIIEKSHPSQRHFERSLVAHKGEWKYQIIEKDVFIEKLNELEQKYIHEWLGKPYHKTYNQNIGGQEGSYSLDDRVQSNYKRIKRIEEKYYEKLKSYKNYLNISETNDTIIFKAKLKKDNTPTEISRKKLNEICELFGIINNEK